jgi:restriction system protein
MAQWRAQQQTVQAAARAQATYLKTQQQMARLQQQATRQVTQQQREYEREQARLSTESRIAEVALQNEQLAATLDELGKILAATLPVDDYLDLDKLKQTPTIPAFNPGNLTYPPLAPDHAAYLPPPLQGIQKRLPWAQNQYAQQLAGAEARYAADFTAYQEQETARQNALAQAHAKYERWVSTIQEQAAEYNAEIDRFQKEFNAGVPEAVTHYFTLILEASVYPDNFPRHAKVAYVPDSKQLIVELDLPPFSVVPEVASYKYIKVRDEISTTDRSIKDRKALYASVLAQVTLRTIHEVFEADRTGRLETVVFNGYVESIDPGTGRPVRTCLVTLRTSRDIFAELDLAHVDPIACLNRLQASISRSPADLAPVRPVLEFNMVDPRFIQETDVLSALDQRPNLMELTPSEFESLIANLFQKMGLQTRLTQASRDGGVDCVAYDERPILGGKVVIQAKRYKHTVGVSAVRDLFGTMHNEGASKGILVTTSGFGKAAYEFAQGKPLELLTGSNLLYLLELHAGIQARIEMPEDWRDPELDVQEA